jgi:hypothetical protein
MEQGDTIQMTNEDTREIEISPNEHTKALTDETSVQTDRMKITHIKAGTIVYNSTAVCSY